MTGALTKDLLCVRGCQTEATGVAVVDVVVVTAAVATAVSVTFLGVSTTAETLVVVGTTTGGEAEPLGGCGGFLDFCTVAVTLALFRLFEGTEELRPRFSLGSSVAVVVGCGGGAGGDGATTWMEGEGVTTGTTGITGWTGAALGACCGFVSSLVEEAVGVDLDFAFLLLGLGLNKRVSSLVVTTLRVGTGSEDCGGGTFADSGGVWLR